jgi:beta-mannanase
MRRPVPLARALRPVCALILLALLFALPSAASARTGVRSWKSSPSSATALPARTWKSGVFHGYGPAGDLAFGTWRGAAVQTATDFTAWDDWALIENPQWDIAAWQPVPSVQPTLSMPMWPNTGGSLAQAASGADNAHWAVLGANLVAAGMDEVTLRIGWEFNGTWYPWSVGTAAGAARYAAAWRQIVGTLKAVPGQHFSFDWAPTLSPGGIDPALAYPGDAYVTNIALSVYDWNQRPDPTAAQRWSDLVNNGYGLAWQAQFALAHHKQISFPEWGLAHNAAAPAAGGGDDTTFIQNMYSWFAAHNTAYENYFDSDTTYGLYSGITTGSGRFPNAAALYRRLW